jgi:hypothetical protein
MSKIIMPISDVRPDFQSEPVLPLEIRKYKNASKIPPGIYQNFDLHMGDNIFVQVNDDDLYLTNDYKKLQHAQIVEKVYRDISPLPFVAGLDSRRQSCFRNWFIPSASYRFSVTSDHVDVSLIKKDLSLDEYTHLMYDRVIENLKSIYSRHDRVYLHYSGGIDSLVCLSFILKLGLQKRTTLLYFKNLPEISHQYLPEASFLHPVKLQAIENLFADMADQMHSIITDCVTLSDFLHQLNHGTFIDILAYSTATMIQKYPDGAHIGGHLGNESLLHWHIYINDVLQAGHDIEQLKELSKKTVYSQNHVLRLMLAILSQKPASGPIQNFDQTCVDQTLDYRSCEQWLLPVMEFKHHSLVPRSSLNSHGSVKFYHPLMDETISELHRKLHWRDIDFNYLVDAKLARDVMKVNVGNRLDQYVTSDGQDCDSTLSRGIRPWVRSFMLSADKINPKLLTVPDNLCHDDNGFRWLNYALRRVNTHGTSIKMLMTFKTINHLSKLCAGELDLYSPNPRYKF